MKPYYETPVTRLYQGDARDLPLPDESVHCVVTSPPYWGLRDYGIEPSVWGENPTCDHSFAVEQIEALAGTEGHWQQAENGPGLASGQHGTRFKGDLKAARQKKAVTVDRGFCRRCGAWRGNLGLEPTPELFVEHIVEVFREVWRVLRPDGTCWVNLGDSYAGSGKGQMGNGQHSPEHGTKQGTSAGTLVGGLPVGYTGLKPKDMVGIPWRVAFALQADGWYLRSDIIWSKPNPMPESVADRPTKSHEYLFLLTKAPRYFYDAEAVREPQRSDHPSGNGFKREARLSYLDESGPRGSDEQWKPSAAGRNRRTVWEIATQPMSGAVVHGSHRTVLPDCPVHGCLASHVPVAVDGVPRGVSQSARSRHIDGRHAQGLLSSALSTSEGQAVNPSGESVAIDHSKETNRKDSVSGQDGSSGDEESSHTEYTESPLHLRTAASDTAESKIEEDSASSEREIDREGRIRSCSAHTQTPELTYQDPPDNCSCQYTGKVAKKIDHFAGFPEALVEPCILAGTSERGVCAECGAPWARVVDVEQEVLSGSKGRATQVPGAQNWDGITQRTQKHTKTTGWRPSCDHQGDVIPATVLDPFAGSATVSLVAQKLGRHSVGVDLSEEYLALAQRRLEALSLPMEMGVQP